MFFSLNNDHKWPRAATAVLTASFTLDCLSIIYRDSTELFFAAMAVKAGALIFACTDKRDNSCLSAGRIAPVVASAAALPVLKASSTVMAESLPVIGSTLLTTASGRISAYLSLHSLMAFTGGVLSLFKGNPKSEQENDEEKEDSVRSPKRLTPVPKMTKFH